MRSWAYNCFGVLMGTSWRASCSRWPSLRADSLPMITLFHSQGDFCATAWQDLYSKKYNLFPLPMGNTGVQMGGWFKFEVKDIRSFDGRVMRISGLGGQVLERLGVKYG